MIIRKLNPSNVEITEAREAIESLVHEVLVGSNRGLIQEVYVAVQTDPPQPVTAKCRKPHTEIITIEIRRIRA